VKRKREIDWIAVGLAVLMAIGLVLAANSCMTAENAVSVDDDAGSGSFDMRMDIVSKYVKTWERGTGISCPFTETGNGFRLTLIVEGGIPRLSILPGIECEFFDDTSHMSVKCRRFVDMEPIANFEEFTVRIFNSSLQDPQGFIYWRADWLQYAECVHMFNVEKIVMRL